MRECALEWVLSGEHCHVWEMPAALGTVLRTEWKITFFHWPDRYCSNPNLCGASQTQYKANWSHLTPLTSGKVQMNGRSWSTDKTWGFHLLLWGHTAWLQTLPTPLPLSCKRILLLDLGSVHPLTLPHLLLLFHRIIITLKTKTPCEDGSLQGDPITLR